jgi:predicted O-methyltransferase YrrM
MMLTKKPWRLGTRAKLLMRGLRYSRILPYASVNGWLTVDEAITLYELAKGLTEPKPRAVEIGSWQGKSTICIARGLRDKPQTMLTCIDPFDASGDNESSDEYGNRATDLGGPLRRAFEENLKAADVRDIVDVRPGLSHEHAASFKEPIDLLFLDGNHSYESVRRDFEEWAPKIRAGGFLAMHDVVHPVHTGPRQVVDECIANNPDWTNGHYVDSMFVTQRAPA